MRDFKLQNLVAGEAFPLDDSLESLVNRTRCTGLIYKKMLSPDHYHLIENRDRLNNERVRLVIICSTAHSIGLNDNFRVVKIFEYANIVECDKIIATDTIVSVTELGSGGSWYPMHTTLLEEVKENLKDYFPQNLIDCVFDEKELDEEAFLATLAKKQSTPLLDWLGSK